jgi:hypothetical protein
LRIAPISFITIHLNKFNNYLLDTEHIKMLVKNIIAAFTLAGLATASPFENIEERAACTGGIDKTWCCQTAVSPLNLFFIRGAGSDCISKAL